MLRQRLAGAKAAADAAAKAKAAADAKAKADADAAAKKKAEEEARAKAAADAAAKAKAAADAKAKVAAEAKAAAAAKKKAEEEARAKAAADAAAKAKAAADAKAKADAAAAAKKKAEEAAAVIAAAEAASKAKAEEIARKKAERVAEQKAIDAKYKAEIAKADKALGEKDYTYAKNTYKVALSIKPNEKYPGDKIKEIDKAIMLAAQKQALEDAKNREKEQQYVADIAEGDLALKKKDYALAKQNYSEALQIKAGEKYPADKLKEIERILAENAKAEEAARAKAAADAIAKKKAGDEAAARAAKEEAAKSKAEAEKALKAMYDGAIAKGDKLFRSKKYDEANAFYQEAANLKENESYPKEKIAEIRKIQDAALKVEADAESAEEENEKKYNSNIKNGDMSMKFKEYTDAKQFYTEASKIKPAETYPKTKLEELETLLAAQKLKNQKKDEIKKQYDAAVARGDKNFLAKDLEAAKTAYNDALGIKSDAAYPKDKIAEIDKIIKTEQERAAAEETARAAKEARAKEEAEAAAKKKADEEASARAAAAAAAKKKAEDEANARAAAEEEARRRAEEAEKASAAAEVAAKKKAEEDAAARLAAEAAAKKKAEEQRKSEEAAKVKARDDQYNKLIADADKAFQSKDYGAIRLYESASNIKPNEKYPKDKIAEINEILEGNKAREDEYVQALSDGNKNLADRNYMMARGNFEEALKIKPNASVPKTKIAQIDKVMGDLARKKVAEESAHRRAEEERKLREAKERAHQEEIARQKALKAKQLAESADQMRLHQQKEKEAALSMSADERERMLSELALEYPEGLTEEKFMDGQKKIVRRIVVFEGRADEYKMVIQPWGAKYYFKNHASIPKHQFDRETNEVDL